PVRSCRGRRDPRGHGARGLGGDHETCRPCPVHRGPFTADPLVASGEGFPPDCRIFSEHFHSCPSLYEKQYPITELNTSIRARTRWPTLECVVSRRFSCGVGSVLR